MLKELECTKKTIEVEIAKLRARKNKLATTLKEKQNDWLNKQQTYEESIMSLVGKLKDESVNRQRSEMQNAEQKEALQKQVDTRVLLVSNVTSALKMFAALKEDNGSIKNNVMLLKSMHNKLLSFMLNFVDKVKQVTFESDEEKRMLSREIDYLNSQLVAEQNSVFSINQQFRIEKSRAVELENNLVIKHNQLLDEKKQLVQAKEDGDAGLRQFSKYKERIETKLNSVEKERTELNKQVKELLERNNSLEENSRRQEDEISKRKNEIVRKDGAFNKSEKSVEELKTFVCRLKEEKSNHERAYAEIKGSVFDLENQVGIERSHATILLDNVSNLKWKCKQSAAEASSRVEEIKLLESQHRAEVESLVSMLGVTKAELSSIRSELSDTRQEKQASRRQLVEANERLRQKTCDFDCLKTEVCKRNGALLKLRQEMQDTRSISLREIVELVVNKAVIDFPRRSDDERKDVKKRKRNK